MSKYFLILFLATVTAGGAWGQKVISDPNVQKREVSGYHAISVANGVKVILTQGVTEAVAVSAVDEEARDRIKTVVEDGVLKIFYELDYWKLRFKTGDKKPRAYVSVVNLDKIIISAGADITVDGTLKTNSLCLNAMSGGTFEGQIDGTDADIRQSSGSRIFVSGMVKKLICSGNSGSRLSGYNLVVSDCEAKSQSGARMEITVNGELSAHASSGGRIQYRGKGMIRNVRSNSGGHISRG